MNSITSCQKSIVPSYALRKIKNQVDRSISRISFPICFTDFFLSNFFLSLIEAPLPDQTPDEPDSILRPRGIDQGIVPNASGSGQLSFLPRKFSLAFTKAISHRPGRSVSVPCHQNAYRSLTSVRSNFSAATYLYASSKSSPEDSATSSIRCMSSGTRPMILIPHRRRDPGQNR